MIGLELFSNPILVLDAVSTGISLLVTSSSFSWCRTAVLLSVPFMTTDRKERPSIAGEGAIPARSRRVGAISIDRTGTETFCLAVMFGPRIQKGT